MQTRAIIGLGNPGRQYKDTRHNCGFRFIERLASQCQVSLKLNPRLQCHLVRTRINEIAVWLVQPITYVNRSGSAYRLVTDYYEIDPKDTIVVHDELDLPTGTVRLKTKGGGGGHNGIADIIQHCGSREFLRVRIGIGRPQSSAATVPYVLSVPPQSEQALIDDAISDTLRSLDDIVTGKLAIAMNRLHSRPSGGDETTCTDASH
ncbi:MAG: aminoacyl-tRNA hydrolase [Acidiferrobacterales bacterium]|nr:aminoacyl-tRNA hydrolase [Acidiferrobacterales bacterium]